MQLSDYAQALGAAQRLVPNVRDLRQQDAQTRILETQPQLIEQQIAASKQQVQEGQLKQQRQQMLQSRLVELGTRPSPERLYRLGVEFPEFAQPISQAAKAVTEDRRAGVVRQLAPIQALIQNGQTDKALAEVERHIAADKAAGQEPDENDVELRDMLASKDPAQIKAAGGIVYGLLAAVNPDTAASNLNKRDENAGGQYTLAPGSKRFDADGNLIASADFAPDRFTLSPGQTRFENATGGGDPASGGGGSAGSGAPRSVRNNNPGNLRASAFTRKLPGFQSVDADGFAVFDSPSSGAAAQGALLSSYIDRGYNTVAKIINRWAPPSDNNDTGAYIKSVAKALNVAPGQVLSKDAIPQLQSIISRVEGGPGSSSRGTGSGPPGGVRAVASAPANLKEGYRLLTPEENQARGLDANIKYQEGPNGQLAALGGQSRAQLKPIPPAAADALVSNKSSISNIDRAIKLLDPRNQSREAKNARYAIGTSNRFIPDAVLQNTNPDGVSFRAQIGQIGGLLIKDISGAAVSASEDNRLAKWVPLVTDTPRAAMDKLKNLRRELANKNSTIASTYNEEQGYRDPNRGTTKASPAAAGGFRILKVRPK